MFANNQRVLLHKNMCGDLRVEGVVIGYNDIPDYPHYTVALSEEDCSKLGIKYNCLPVQAQYLSQVQ